MKKKLNDILFYIIILLVFILIAGRIRYYKKEYKHIKNINSSLEMQIKANYEDFKDMEEKNKIRQEELQELINILQNENESCINRNIGNTTRQLLQKANII